MYIVKKMFQINKLLSQKILFVISNTIQILGTHLVPLLVNCCSQSGPKNKTKNLTVVDVIVMSLEQKKYKNKKILTLTTEKKIEDEIHGT